MAPRPVPWSQGRKYGVVVDAGSSGSRVQVYSWVDPQIAREQRLREGKSVDVLSKVQKGVEEGDRWHMKVEPGISTYGPKPDELGAYLRPLLEFAESVIPPDQHKSTPIYVLATAGMRLLPDSQQAAVLSETCAFIKGTTGFLLPSCETNVRVITGEEEGLYGWISVNYLMDGFDMHEHSHGDDDEPHSSTYGFLDMGGASTQIAFEPSDVEQVRHADNLLEVKLNLLSGKAVRHPVFVTTWLGFGTNQARDRYIDQQIKAHVKQSDADHLPGSSEGLGSEHPVVLIDDPCLPKDLLLSEKRHDGYTLRGTGDFATCVRRTGPLLNKEVECLDDPCLFNGVHVPPIDFSVNHFIGISEYWYSTQDVWGTQGGVYDFVEFEKNAMAFCGRKWSDIMEDHRGGAKFKPSIELSRLETQCFKAAWIINILHEGIGIPRVIDRGGQGDGLKQGEKGRVKAEQKGLTPSFQSMNEVGDVAISWTLGKMVLEVSRGSTEAKDHTMNPSGGVNESSGYHLPSGSPDDVGHTPTFSGDVKDRLAHLPLRNEPVAYIAVVALAVFVYVFFFSGIFGSRRRRSFSLSSMRDGFVRRSKYSYSLANIEDGGNSGDSTSSTSSITSGRGVTKKAGLTAKVTAPLRLVVFKLSSALQSWSRPRGADALPSFRADPSPPRPRQLRQVASSPALVRSAGGMPVNSMQNAAPPQHYNDAPDLSEMRAATKRVVSGAPLTRTNTPMTMSVVAPTPASISPGWSTPTGVSSSLNGRLTPRSRPASTEDAPEGRPSFDGTVAGGGGNGNSELASAVWDSVSARNSSSSLANEYIPTAGVPKLRAPKSGPSSQVNLASGFFGAVNRPGP